MSQTVAKHLIDQLIHWGCQRIYGVLGDANLHLLDELAKQGGIRYIACRTEAGAALMASAEAKLMGKPGICLATSGPGVASLLNGLADAAADRAPVLAITGQVELRRLGTGSKQEIDQQRLMEPIADYTALVADGKGFSVQLNLAYGTAWNRGAVAHLSIPKNVWTQKADGVIYPSPPVLPKVFSPPDQLEEAAKQLEQAKRPVLLVGRGIGRDGAKAVALAERLQAPIIVTMPAKPLLPNHHPLFVGGLGQAGSQAATDLLKAADLFVILGATWWPEEYVPERISIIQVDARPENIGRTHPCLVALVGGVSYVLDQWLNRLRQRENSAWVHEIKKHRQNWVKRVEQEISQQTIPLAPARVMVVLGTMVKPDAIVAVDVGDHTLWFERAFPFRGQDLLLSGRWRTLGFALPAAIAAQLAKPDRQVIAFAGDGGFSTTLVEMATAATLGLPLKVFVLNNGAYAMEKNRMSVAGMYPLGASLLNPDFVRLAEAFGFKGMRVKREEELAIMKEALSADQPALVEIQCAQTMVPHTKI